MSTPVEERLRRALAQQADATVEARDGWRRIEARLGGQGRPHRPGFVRWTILAPTAAAVLGLALVAVVLGRGEDKVHVTGGAGRLYLLPTEVDPRFRLASVDTEASVDNWRPGVFRAYGRRAPDGLALEASVVVTVPENPLGPNVDPEPAPLRVRNRDVAVSTDHHGLRMLSWVQADGQTVGVLTYGLSEPQLVTLADSLLDADATRADPALPPGFVPLREGSFPAAPFRFTTQGWEADHGALFSLIVTEVPGVTMDDVAWQLSGGRAKNVRGTMAIYSDRKNPELMWIERPGTVITLQGIGVSEAELTAIAEGLRPLSESEWRELADRVVPRPEQGRTVALPGAPRPLTPSNSFFVVRDLIRTFPPPCQGQPSPGGPPPEVIATVEGGREMQCHEVGPPWLTADDVLTATARQDGGTGRWEVEFTLTREGTGRLDSLAKALGAGGQIAIVVDGRVVAAPRLASGSLGDRGIVSGLDEQTARSLAQRLRP